MSEMIGPPIKTPYVGNIRWAFMKWADIESARHPGHTYLRRLRIFQTPWFALYLHFIFEPDLDADPHDHPCNFWSLIVRGGYTEVVYLIQNLRNHHFVAENFTWRRGTLHYMPISRAHRIVELTPGTISLCWFGPRRKRWGFWTANGYVSSEEYDRTADAFVA